jgi:hypothetical protein
MSPVKGIAFNPYVRYLFLHKTNIRSLDLPIAQYRKFENCNNLAAALDQEIGNSTISNHDS